MSTPSPYDPAATAIAKQFGMYDPKDYPEATQRTIDEILAILNTLPLAEPECLSKVQVMGEFRCCRCGRSGKRPNEEFELIVDNRLRKRTIRPLCGPCVQELEHDQSVTP